MHCLPSMIGGKEEAFLLINTLAQGKNAGSADQLRMSELNVVNTNAGKKKKRNQTESGSVMIDLTEEMTIDIAVTMAEVKRRTREYP